MTDEDPRVDILATATVSAWPLLSERTRNELRPGYRDLLARLDAARDTDPSAATPPSDSERRCDATTREGAVCGGRIDPEYEVCESEDEHHGTAGIEPWVTIATPPQGLPLDRAALVHALTHTPFVVNTGVDPTPVGGSRPLSGTEANDVADLVFGPVPHRVDSPFADAGHDDAHRRAARDAIAFGVMCTDREWNGDTWHRHQWDARLDDLTDQYMQQVPEAATSPAPEGGDPRIGILADALTGLPPMGMDAAEVERNGRAKAVRLLARLDALSAPLVATPPQEDRAALIPSIEWAPNRTEAPGEFSPPAAPSADGGIGDATCRYRGVSLPPPSYLEQEQ